MEATIQLSDAAQKYLAPGQQEAVLAQFRALVNAGIVNFVRDNYESDLGPFNIIHTYFEISHSCEWTLQWQGSVLMKFRERFNQTETPELKIYALLPSFDVAEFEALKQRLVDAETQRKREREEACKREALAAFGLTE